jgi:hypothetical protein
MSNLKEFLANQSGDAKEEGEFTLDPARAMQLVGEFSSDKPFWYLAPLLQALFLDEVKSIEVFVDKREVKIVAYLRSQSNLRDGKTVFSSLGKPSDTSSVGLFCRALLGARVEKGLEDLTVVTENGTLTLQSQPEFTSARQTLGKIVWHARYSWGWLQGASHRIQFLRAAQYFAWFYPGKIVIDGRPPVNDWPSCPTMSSPPIPELSLCCEEFRGGGTVGFWSPDLSAYQQAEEGLYLYDKGKSKTQRFLPLACTIIARELEQTDFQSVVSITSFRNCHIFMVRHGVLLESSLLNLPNRLDELGVLIVVDLSDFKVDASALKFVRDERLVDRLRELFEQARALNLAYLRHADPGRTARLKRQGGALGFLKGALAATPISHLSREKAEERELQFAELLESEVWDDVARRY